MSEQKSENYHEAEQYSFQAEGFTHTCEQRMTTCEESVESPALDPRQAVQNLLGDVDWQTDTEGFCDCPGKHLHHNRDGHKDCMIFLDHVPTLHCLHSSCKDVIENTNRQLRKALLHGDCVEKKRLTPQDKARITEATRKLRIRQRAAESKKQILQTNRWTYQQIVKDSPVDVSSNVEDHWKLLLQCFQADDVVWTGDIQATGKPEYQRRFRPVMEWLKDFGPTGQFICPATFKPGSFSRSNENIVARRFLVVESDTLGRDEVGAVFYWLKNSVGLGLRAIVDTAGKSLHAWFDYPPDNEIDELKLILPELGCDPKLFAASQPVRLPSARREEKYQKLIYLAKEVVQ